MSEKVVLEAEGLEKSYGSGSARVSVLRGAGLRVPAGKVVSVVGPSGSGKSTLLHVCGALDPPDGGTVRLCGEDVWRMGEARRSRLRNSSIGFVFQLHHLLEEFTLLENVAMPALISGMGRSAAMKAAGRLLGEVGLSGMEERFPAETSGGERQRAAVARALVLRPSLVLADEPTGNLDAESGARVEEIMLGLAAGRGLAFVIATHDRELAASAHIRLRLQAGSLHPAETG